MPLTEAEREVLTSHPNGNMLANSSAHWANWPEAANRLWVQRRQVVAWVVAGFVISVVLAFFYSKYESTVQIMPPDESSSGLAALAIPALTKTPALAGMAGDLLGTKSTGAVFIKILDSRTVQDDLINRFDLRKHYSRRYWEDARLRLSSNTTISIDKKSGVITLTVRDRDPELAKKLAGAYVDELNTVVAKVSTSAARRERIFIEQRLAEETRGLEESELRFSQFASTNMTLDVPEQTRVTVQAAARLQGELVAARAQLEGLRTIYTAENYRVKSLRAQITELEHELAKINSGVAVPGAVQDPTSPYPSVKSLPVLGVKWADLYRNQKIHETVVDLLTQQYELVRIQEAKEIPTVKVLDSASDPEKMHPRPWIFLAVGILISTTLACAGVLLRDRWETWDEQDPRRVLLVQIFRGSHTLVASITGKLRRGASQPDQQLSQK